MRHQGLQTPDFEVPALRLELRTKNNRLWTEIQKRWGHGHYTGVRRCCAELGLHESVVGQLMNLRQSPYLQTTDGRPVLRKAAQVLCDALYMFPDDLFPRSLYSGVMPKRVLVATVEPEQFSALSASDRPKLITDGAESLDASVLAQELKQAVAKALHTLPPREQIVIRRRFGLDGPEQTLRAIGEELGIEKERVRQIVESALRNLRHPTRTAIVEEFADRQSRDRARYRAGYGELLNARRLATRG